MLIRCFLSAYIVSISFYKSLYIIFCYMNFFHHSFFLDFTALPMIFTFSF